MFRKFKTTLVYYAKDTVDLAMLAVMLIILIIAWNRGGWEFGATGFLSFYAIFAVYRKATWHSIADKYIKDPLDRDELGLPKNK